MKKIWKEMFTSLLVLIFLIVGVVIALVYIPKETKLWESKIGLTVPEEYLQMSDVRKNILQEFDDFVLDSATSDRKNILQIVFSRQFKLNWLLQEGISEELGSYSEEDVLKVWYVYNMGIIGKVNDTVVCFDLSTVVPTPSLLKLANSCDYIFLSHGDGDHLNALVLKNVLENGGKVVIQDDTGMWKEIIKKLVSEDLYGNIYNLDSEKEYEVGDIKVYSLMTTHRGSTEEDNAWMYVSVDDFNILHTGDGTLNDSKGWEKFKDIDLLLANTIIQPIDLRDSNARYIIPLHMHELSHDMRFLKENSFATYFEKLKSFEGTIPSKIYPLMWGESIEIWNI